MEIMCEFNDPRGRCIVNTECTKINKNKLNKSLLMTII